MPPTRTTLQLAGVLDMAEAVCDYHGTDLTNALRGNCKNQREARFLLIAVLSSRGWSDERIINALGISAATVNRALDDVHISQVRRFVPRKAS